MDSSVWICVSLCVAGILAAAGVDGSDRLLDRQYPSAVSISGDWQFKLDPGSAGEKEHWFEGQERFSEHIAVPGCWDAQGKGVPGTITTVANADDTQPNVRAVSAYTGDAWYRRTFRLPESWRGKVIWLNVGGVNDRAKVWINGQSAGLHDGYCTGFKLDITDVVQFGKSNQCSMLVSNASRPEGNLEGCFDFYTDWGGIYRDVWLDATDRIWIESILVIPQLADDSIRVRLKVLGKQSASSDMRVRYTVLSTDKQEVVSSGNQSLGFASMPAELEITVPIPDPKLWSPQSPYLYYLRVQILEGDKIVDSVLERFGMRDIRVQGKRILLNGKPIFLRGYGTDGIYPITIAPPASKELYLKELGRAKSYGFNFARQHTWIPLPEHLDAADELGILMQIEMPTGLHPFNHPSPFLAKLWTDELQRVIEEKANHPSWVIFSMGNELGDALKDQAVQKTYYGLTALARKLDPSRLVIVTSGSTTPLPPEEPIYSRGVYGITPLESAAESLTGWIAGHDRPYVWHEMGYYASYPDVDLSEKYTGGAIPFWLDEAARVADEKGFTKMLPTYVRNSVRLQGICRKWSMELARKIPDLAGFEWWTFKDNSWPIEGIVDDFTDPKRGVDIEAVRRLNADTVLLLADEPRTARAGDTLHLKALASHFGSHPFKNAGLQWELIFGTTVVEQGTIAGLSVDRYGLSGLAALEVLLPKPDKPGKYVLRLHLSDGSRSAENEWPVWVFPAAGHFPKDTAVYDSQGSLHDLPFPAHRITSLMEAADASVVISTALSDDLISYTQDGGHVLLISRKARTGLPERTCAEESPDIPYPLYFAPTYWGAPYAPGGGNLGTVIAEHPAIGSFPNEGFCDLQFLRLVQGVDRADLDALPVRVDPIIRSITDWRLGANAAYIYEVKVGKGGLLVTTLNFEEGLSSKRPESEWLLQELLGYCSSDRFKPAVEIPTDFLRKICPDR